MTWAPYGEPAGDLNRPWAAILTAVRHLLSVLVRTCSTYSFKRAASARPEHGRGSPSREARKRVGCPPPRPGWKGARAAGGRQPVPLPLARQRTGAGRCRHAVTPAPARGGPRRHAPPVTAPARANRAVLPRRASCRRESSQSRARLRHVPPLRSGQTLDSELPRQDRHLSGGRPRIGTVDVGPLRAGLPCEDEFGIVPRRNPGSRRGTP